MKKPGPIGFDFPQNRIDPKGAVPDSILEQHPWHWDPMKTDHTDREDSYMGQIGGDFDWAALGKFAIQRANADQTPEKWWSYDADTDTVYHSTDDVNNMPIREQALLALKNNGHNEHNSQYFKTANAEFGDFYEPLKAMFPRLKKDKMGISMFVQPPGHAIWSHVDTYSSFIRRTGDERPDYSRLRRYMVFVRDWDFGHFFHYGNHCFNQWRAGECWDLTPGVYHGSANAGVSPKITIHWSGELED